jgi:lysophospholipase L1-like esterase
MKCLTQIYAVAPKVKIVWAQCLWKTAGWPQNIQITNAHQAATAVAKAFIAKGKRIVLVDPSVGFNPLTMTVDGVHPTPAGYQQMASCIEKGFKQITEN